MLSTGINLIDNLLNDKYPTTLEHDLQILDQPDLSYRAYLAVTHRTAQKEILESQGKLLKILLFVVGKITAHSGMKDAYMERHEEFEENNDVMMANRMRFRKYF